MIVLIEASVHNKGRIKTHQLWLSGKSEFLRVACTQIKLC